MASIADVDKETADKNNVFAARPYQVELLNHALEKNTIICLGTGTGKTFISVMLIKDLAHQIDGTLASNGKRTFFLVTSVPLVFQQGDVIKKHTNLRIGQYVGDMGVDFWDKKKWTEEFDKHQVLVMTAQILCDMLAAGHLKICNINLLILDECHNATKNHVYVQIMKFFNHEGQNPRILGLTASIVNTKCKCKEKNMIMHYINTGLRNLELTLHSACVTSYDPQSVVKYAARPKEKVHRYDLKPGQKGFIELEYKLKEVLEEIKGYLDLISMDTPRYKSPGTTAEVILMWKSDIAQQLSYIMSELGLWCAFKAFKEFKEELEKLKQISMKPETLPVIMYLQSRLEFMQDLCRKFAAANFVHPENTYIQHPLITEKVTELFELILRAKNTLKERDLCSIVFTQRRVTAVVLSSTINDIAMSNQHEGIRSNYILGHAMGSSLRLNDVRMSSKEQEKILKAFRRLEFNVLVSTSVIEEGLDVQKCNLVVKFDGIQTYREYAQAKGRARAKNSEFIVFANSLEYEEVDSNLKVMKVIEQVLQEKCHDREVPEKEDIQRHFYELDCLLPPIRGSGNEPGWVTRDNAIALMHRYCNKLWKDKYTNNRPLCSWSTVTQTEKLEEWFVASITLPKTCPLLERIEGDAMPCKKLAKTSAAMKVCVKLYELGELDNRFFPITIDDLDDQGDEESDCDSDPEPKQKIYDQKVPCCFVGNAQDESGYFLYSFSLKPLELLKNDFGSRWNDLFEKKEYRALGFLMLNKFPEIPPVELRTHAGIILMTVSLVQKLVSLSPDVKQKLMKFHEYVFDDFCVLFSNNKVFYPFENFHFILCPLLMTRGLSPELSIDHLLLNSWPTPTRRGEMAEVVKKSNADNGSFFVFKRTSDWSMKLEKDDYYNYPDYLEGCMQNTHPSERHFIDAYRVPSGKQYLTPHTGQYDSKRSKRRQILMEDFCTEAPLSALQAFQAACIPAFLHRAVSLMLADELRSEMKSALGISSEFSARAEFSVLQTCLKTGAKQTLKPSLSKELYTENVKQNITVIDSLTEELKLYFLNPKTFRRHGLSVPGVDKILEALTTKKACAGFDLERLEFLGDSLLKMAVTVDITLRYHSFDEGRLTKLRTRAVSNKNLLTLAKRKNLHRLLNHSSLTEKSWMPPSYANKGSRGFSVPSENDEFCFLKQKIKDKKIADSVEALIGAFLEQSNLASALKLMEWFGILQGDEYHQRSDLNQNDEVILMYETHNFRDVESKVDYEFSRKDLLIEAFTHSSFDEQRFTGCYQRLEFLGDSLLDFLVSYCIYFKQENLSPGDLTDLRSAIVCNNTLALLTVKSGFNKLLQLRNPALFQDIRHFLDVCCVDDKAIEIALKNPFEIESSNTEEGIIPPKVLGDVFESLAGAIFLDSGMDLNRVWKAYSPLLMPLIDLYLEDVPKQPFRKLNELYPQAKVKYSTVADDMKKCEITVKDQTFSAIGKSKIAAKNKASQKAIGDCCSDRSVKTKVT